jgi:NAD(P)-dependent dehydrogenase (short-subunit alcohol dehydrogenase family)
VTNGKTAVVLGVGPGLGSALAQRFAQGGFAVGLMARSRKNLTPVEDEIARAGGKTFSVEVDASEPASVAAGFARIRDELGHAEVMIYNAGAFQMGGILEITPADFERCWRANCFGAFLAAQEVLPGMVERRRGTLLFTGATAALRGSARFACLAVGKFGLRGLAQSLAREFGPSGIHVAHVVIDGQIDTPRSLAVMPGREAHTLLSPGAIAETYWQIHVQHPTVWTHEIDVRPSVEKF